MAEPSLDGRREKEKKGLVLVLVLGLGLGLALVLVLVWLISSARFWGFNMEKEH